MLITDHMKLVRRASDIITVGARLRPYHVRLHITNQCNLSCEFCLYKDRDISKEISIDKMIDLVSQLVIAGCKAVTLTGGGEPLMHPEAGHIIQALASNWMDLGLETNGFLLGTISKEKLRHLSWCSITVSDDTELDSLMEVLHQKVPHIMSCSFNYVVTKKFRPKQLAQVLRNAERLSFSQVTVVSDMTDLANVPSMYDVRQYMVEEEAPLDQASFHGYKMYASGSKRCLVSLVKPTIGADGLIYPCSTMIADDIINLSLTEHYNTQSHYIGSKCIQCYHSNHNKVLEKIIAPVTHEEFV